MRALCLLLLVGACESADVKLDVGPVNADQAKAYTLKLLAAVDTGCTPEAMGEFVDEQALVAHVLEHSKAGALQRAQVAADLMKRHTGATVICTWFEHKRDVTFSLLHLKDGAPIVRKTAKLGKITAVTYFRFVLGVTKSDQQVRIDDAYSFTEGTTISEVLADTVDAALKSGGDATVGLESALARVKELRAQGKPLDAMAVLDGLSPELRNVRGIRVIRVFVAREISDERYSQEMADVLTHYPNDPSLALIAIDEATLRKDYAAALKQIDIVDNAIGGDAFQDAVRATTYFAMGDFQNARDRAAAAVKAEPTLARAQLSLIDAEAALGDNRGVLASLETLESLGHHLSAAAIAKLPHYQTFAKSPEFQIWAAKAP